MMSVQDKSIMGSTDELSNLAAPLWSVMIPTYEANELFLKETLDSVLAQDPGPAQMQIEVIDDCSPSSPPTEIVRRIAGERVQVHREPQNLGLARVWNKCIERARGTYIHILHQDDLVYPGFYEAIGKGFQMHPEAGAAFCRHSFCDEHGHWRHMSRLEMAKPGLLPGALEILATRECIQCASIVIKRSTYSQIGGFSTELKHALDWEMWIRIANAFPIFYEPRILASWRKHKSATTTRQIHNGENTADMTKAIAIWSRYLPSQDAQRLSTIARKDNARGALHLAEVVAREGNKDGYRHHIASALECDSSWEIRRKAMSLRLKFLVRPFVRWVLGRR